MVELEKLMKFLYNEGNLIEDKQVIVFGTGSLALKMCKDLNNISFFVDNDEKKWNTMFLLKPVYSPSKLLEMDKNHIVIIIASMFYNDITEQLISMGFLENVQIFNLNLIHQIWNLKSGNKKYNFGYCPICKENTIFIENGEWLRETYCCIKCNSLPRQRAIMYILNLVRSNYYKQEIHESSPQGAVFDVLKRKCENYTYSYYFSDVEPGKYKNNARCENLEQMTFKDSIFDIFITQDVLEHVLNPENVFKEIARVLKKGGIHIFTVPYNPQGPTLTRCKLVKGKVVNLQPPLYHGDPINPDGCIVVTDWGNDLCDYIYKCSGLTTTICNIKNRDLGIDGESLQVFISRKM